MNGVLPVGACVQLQKPGAVNTVIPSSLAREFVSMCVCHFILSPSLTLRREQFP